MSELLTWVSDRLHDMLHISDRNIAEFLLGLCRKSSSPENFLEKIRETDTINIDDNVRQFATQLWGKVPREMSVGDKKKLENRYDAISHHEETFLTEQIIGGGGH